MRFGKPPQVAAILGSGWKERAADLLSDIEEVALDEFTYWPQPRVQGHGAELRMGQLGAKSVLLAGGRVHAYEGYSAREIVRGIRALIAWGTPSVLLLNAAGSLHVERAPGSLMPFCDHLNISLPNPLMVNQRADSKRGFLNLVGLYDSQWREDLLRRHSHLREGVYAGLTGPSYETPAEVRWLQSIGADAVGMSTIPEAMAAKDAGAKVMAISMLTNYAAGISGSEPDHQEVLETAAAHSEQAAEVLQAAIDVASFQ